MSHRECLLPLLFVLFIGGIVGLGWLVLQPLGKMKDRRVTVPRFLLLDLLWLIVLLQPVLAVFAWYWHAIGPNGLDQISMLAIAGLLVGLSGVTVAWATMTGALSQAGVARPLKRAAGVLIILPMIGVIIPLAMGFNCALLVAAFDGFRDYSDLSQWVKLGHVAADVAFVAAMFGRRWLSRWIASGAVDCQTRK